ncbi:DUF397 domain-containing protein [Streptomyces sp. I05A-00742]|uniref:DUF397 domain-containing protein n=1 Tax=Streptomyces sp. I05A-00742 TaxID=2732853 RepID=UPI001488B4FF|nr:DUF397 domain-containing protein [Streptomyces sp. I05A-00742]
MTEAPNWRTSSYTKSDNCVEVADNNPPAAMVRDTKERDGGALIFPSAAWAHFIEFGKTLNV